MKRNLKALLVFLLCVGVLTACTKNVDESKNSDGYASIQKGYFDKYLEKVDSDYAKKIGLELGKFKDNEKLGYRTAGSKSEYEAGKYLEQEMKNIGLTDVTGDEIKVDKWEFEKADLIFKDAEGKEIKSVLGGYQADFDTKGQKEFDIVYAGKGTKEDYNKLDVKGKLVLLDINQREEWWVNYPAMQAYLKGAAAVIVSQEGGYAEVDEKSLNAQDICGPTYTPAFSISKHDRNILKKAIESGKTRVKFDAKSNVELNQKTYNYVGKIEGKDKDSLIVYSAHYDAYFEGFQDNSMSVGLMMSIAKAMVDSGYKPEKTIVFVALAAEEWGVSNTRYDWSTGAYRQVSSARPEWVGKAVLDMNFELPAYEHETTDQIRSIYELKDYMTEFTKLVPSVEGVYKDGVEVVAPLRTWSDDFSFATLGIPALRNDFQDSDFMKTHYHSQFDNKNTYNEKALKYHQNLYGMMGIYYDTTAVVPLDFSERLEAMKKSLNQKLNEDSDVNYSQLVIEIDNTISLSKNIIKRINNLNRDYREALYKKNSTEDILKEAKSLNGDLLKIFKYVETNFTKLTWDDEPIFAHENPQNNILALKSAKDLIEAGDDQRALDEELYKVDDNWYAYSFDKEVYDYFANYVLKADDEHLMWGKGKIVSHRSLYDLIDMLQNKGENKDYSRELDMIDDAINGEKEILKTTINSEINSVKELNKMLEKLK